MVRSAVKWWVILMIRTMSFKLREKSTIWKDEIRPHSLIPIIRHCPVVNCVMNRHELLTRSVNYSGRTLEIAFQSSLWWKKMASPFFVFTEVVCDLLMMWKVEIAQSFFSSPQKWERTSGWVYVRGQKMSHNLNPQGATTRNIKSNPFYCFLISIMSRVSVKTETLDGFSFPLPSYLLHDKWAEKKVRGVEEKKTHSSRPSWGARENFISRIRWRQRHKVKCARNVLSLWVERDDEKNHTRRGLKAVCEWRILSSLFRQSGVTRTIWMCLSVVSINSPLHVSHAAHIDSWRLRSWNKLSP